MNVVTYECECIYPLNWWFWQFDKMTKGSEVFPKIIILTFQGIKWLKVRKYHTLTYPFKNGWELCTCGCKIMFIIFFTWLWKWWMRSKKWIFIVAASAAGSSAECSKSVAAAKSVVGSSAKCSESATGSSLLNVRNLLLDFLLNVQNLLLDLLCWMFGICCCC